MQFVEALKPAVALALPAALVAALSGCASMPDPVSMVKQATGSAETKAAEATPPAAPAGAAPAERAVAADKAASAPAKEAEPEVPVDPRAQAAFDAARRAMRAGRSDEAAAQLKALAASSPELGGVHANLGLLYRQVGKLPESAAALEKAVQASPKQAVFRNQLGITYRMQGQFAKARDEYEKAIALDPAYASAVLNLGILNDLYLQDRRRALALYDQYLAMSGGDTAVTKWVADLKNRKDDHVALGLKERP
jgi:Flp pilus assembly protein TadD